MVSCLSIIRGTVVQSWSVGSTQLVRYPECPLVGGWLNTSSVVISFGATASVRYREVVRSWEGPLWYMGGSTVFRLPPWEHVNRSTTLINSTWVTLFINYSWEKLCDFASLKHPTLIREVGLYEQFYAISSLPCFCFSLICYLYISLHIVFLVLLPQ